MHIMCLFSDSPEHCKSRLVYKRGAHEAIQWLCEEQLWFSQKVQHSMRTIKLPLKSVTFCTFSSFSVCPFPLVWRLLMRIKKKIALAKFLNNFLNFWYKVLIFMLDLFESELMCKVFYQIKFAKSSQLPKTFSALDRAHSEYDNASSYL